VTSRSWSSSCLAITPFALSIFDLHPQVLVNFRRAPVTFYTDDSDGEDDPIISTTDEDIEERFPKLRFVHVDLGPHSANVFEDLDVHIASLWTYLETAQFFRVVVAMGILVQVYDGVHYLSGSS
jgi:pterin-4a-carbinolamine dehydratase